MRIKTTVLLCLLAFQATSILLAQNAADSEPDPVADKPEKPSVADIEQAKADARLAAEEAFSKLLTGATLTGNFTVDDGGPVDPAKLLKPDRYELATVKKVKDDVWLFVYVHKGVPIPLTMRVLWAGSTPVLTLDEFTIAGMGTFSARLMFHDNLYAGTWKHGQKGGLMFGRIETAESQKRPVFPAKAAPQPREPGSDSQK
ncbi:MAG: hypothetical protein O3B86_03490 [Planctomycetota bacterium]|nr:hypothetical protein [Planctomycetota bacterium]